MSSWLRLRGGGIVTNDQKVEEILKLAYDVLGWKSDIVHLLYSLDNNLIEISIKVKTNTEVE